MTKIAEKWLEIIFSASGVPHLPEIDSKLIFFFRFVFSSGHS